MLLDAGLPEDFADRINASPAQDLFPTDLSSVITAWSSGVSMLSALPAIPFASGLSTTDPAHPPPDNDEAQSTDTALLSSPRHATSLTSNEPVSRESGRFAADADSPTTAGATVETKSGRNGRSSVVDLAADSAALSSSVGGSSPTDPIPVGGPHLTTTMPTIGDPYATSNPQSNEPASSADQSLSERMANNDLPPSQGVAPKASILDSVWTGVDMLRGLNADSIGIKGGTTPLLSSLTDAVASPMKSKSTTPPEPLFESIFDTIDEDTEDTSQDMPNVALCPPAPRQTLTPVNAPTSSTWYAKKEEQLVNRKTHVEAPINSAGGHPVNLPAHARDKAVLEARTLIGYSYLNLKVCLQDHNGTRRSSRSWLGVVANWHVIGTLLCIVVLTALYKLSGRPAALETQSNLRSIASPTDLQANTTLSS